MALRLEYDDRDDPIVEIAAPEDYEAANLGRQIGYDATRRRVSGPAPSTGVRVLELGSFIAGPFAGQLLGDYGADVIKVEPPGDGDPMRRWGVTRDGDSLWWPTIGRNKRSVALDLRAGAGAPARRPPRGAVRRRARELPARRARPVGPRLRRRCRPPTRSW